MPRMEHLQRGELDTSVLVTHRMSLEDSPRGYERFKDKEEGCCGRWSRPRVGAARRPAATRVGLSSSERAGTWTNFLKFPARGADVGGTGSPD